VEAIKFVSFGAETGPVSEMKCPQNVHEISNETNNNVISMG
jgi:hypothetical protein